MSDWISAALTNDISARVEAVITAECIECRENSMHTFVPHIRAYMIIPAWIVFGVGVGCVGIKILTQVLKCHKYNDREVAKTCPSLYHSLIKI
ncbi:Protein of unknown function [Pyronema omphalodes CBS 100304]|uniref:Transmembrane protein n=1 Tax=Pyronema omphalodes (strain CBS 100304) TaxID=1076935 RepID=U4L8G1_PYROM|nr:Protein of unknown function [Pyronema omphalodes CBS 100304]